MCMSIKTLDYVIFSHQANLSKTTKHWDGFVSHCKLSRIPCSSLARTQFLFCSQTLSDKLVSLELSQAFRLNLGLELMTVEYCYLLSTKHEYRLITEYILKSEQAAKANITLIMACCIVKAKVSKQSIPGCWVKPFATTWALNHSIDPSALCSILYTHLESTTVCPGGNFTIV